MLVTTNYYLILISHWQTYRRFQITFKDTLDASQCIDTIKSVCPCKANPHPTHINRHATMLPASLTRAATTVSRPAPVRPAGLSERESTASASIDSRRVPSTMLGYLVENQPFSIAPSSVATNLSSDDSAFVTCSETSHRTDTQVDHWKDGLAKSCSRDLAQSPLPNSSQPSSSDHSITMPPPPVPRRVPPRSADAMALEPPRTANTGDERSQLLTSLSNHPSLYELSRTDLETLVSRVIREEGFLHLVT